MENKTNIYLKGANRFWLAVLMSIEVFLIGWGVAYGLSDPLIAVIGLTAIVELFIWWVAWSESPDERAYPVGIAGITIMVLIGSLLLFNFYLNKNL